ncbi:MAG: DegT/DnrJ/EryC1/StrS family aminotransferase [Caulobacteraceae bacterium]
MKAGLKDLEPFFVLPEETPNSEASWFGFVLTVREDAPFSRDEIVKHLNDHKIGTRLLFGGNLIRQPYMKDQPFRVSGTVDNSDRIMRQTFWIGVYPGLESPHIGYMLQVIRDFVRSKAGVAA